MWKLFVIFILFVTSTDGQTSGMSSVLYFIKYRPRHEKDVSSVLLVTILIVGILKRTNNYILFIL